MAKLPSFSTGFRNTILDGEDVATTFASGTLDMYGDDGTRPADSDATEVGGGTLLASITLPATPFGAAASGVKSLSGSWTDASANATGTFDWFRISESGDGGGASTTAARIDGTIGITAGQFDLVADKAASTITEAVTVDTFTITIPLV